MSCIGTAGHVDHGKSTLVRALTGIDPDRLAEEKSRGMTIDLGFAWVTLPSGREASIVDVPGHEGFIKNMLAGASGIDVALLVVAADEGVMPQTLEHLAILDLLRVQSGVVALTKADLVDDEWLALVREEVAEHLKTTSLAGAPIIACSATTRAGLPELLSALDVALDASPERHNLGRPRLPIDRVFTITGFGTVVTGTLQDGRLHVGQEVQLLPDGRKVRIRGLQTHKQSIEDGRPGTRLAINLAGVAKQDISRGDVLVLPQSIQPTHAVDVWLEALAAAPRPIQHNAMVDVYAGAAEVPARVILLEKDELQPGEQGWAQLRLTRPLVLARGDRFIVRIPSPSLTVGGGSIVEPVARRHRRRDSSVLARLEQLSHGDPEQIILATLLGEQRSGGQSRGKGYGALEVAELVKVTGLTPEEVDAAIVRLSERGAVICVGTYRYAAERWEQLRDRAVALVAEYHATYPLRAGMPREEWRSRLGCGAREAAEVIQALSERNLVEEVASASAQSTGRGAVVRLAGYVPALTPEQERHVERMLNLFRTQPFSPPSRIEVDAELGAEVTAALIARGTFVKVSDTIMLEQSAFDEAVRRIVGFLQTHETITVADARDLLGTSRKYMLAIFEELDERHITRRVGDDRMLGMGAQAYIQAV